MVDHELRSRELSQTHKFLQAARALEAGEDKTRWEDRLGKAAHAKLQQEKPE